MESEVKMQDLQRVAGVAIAAGAAMVYLHEIADPRYKAVTGSLGYISLGVGVVIGILVVVMVMSIIPAGGLQHTQKHPFGAFALLRHSLHCPPRC